MNFIIGPKGLLYHPLAVITQTSQDRKVVKQTCPVTYRDSSCAGCMHTAGLLWTRVKSHTWPVMEVWNAYEMFAATLGQSSNQLTANIIC